MIKLMYPGGELAHFDYAQDINTANTNTSSTHPYFNYNVSHKFSSNYSIDINNYYVFKTHSANNSITAGSSPTIEISNIKIPSEYKYLTISVDGIAIENHNGSPSTASIYLYSEDKLIYCLWFAVHKTVNARVMKTNSNGSWNDVSNNKITSAGNQYYDGTHVRFNKDTLNSFEISINNNTITSKIAGNSLNPSGIFNNNPIWYDSNTFTTFTFKIVGGFNSAQNTSRLCHVKLPIIISTYSGKYPITLKSDMGQLYYDTINNYKTSFNITDNINIFKAFEFN